MTVTAKYVKIGIPVITLNGEAEITIDVNEGTYTELGAKAETYDGKELIVTDITGEVDTTTVGTYIIRYNVTDNEGNVADEVIRTVNVVDRKAPVFESIDKNVKSMEAGDEYQKVAYTVSDNYDSAEDITVTVSEINSSILGIQTVTYTATDKSGNSTSVEIRVRVVDTTAPTISLKNPADATQSFTVGGTFVAPEFNVSDNSSSAEDITIDMNGIIDESVPGTYTVEYTATDWTGNTSEPIIITVKVLNYPPSITYYNKGTKTPIEDGKEYTETLTVEFKGKGILTDLDTGVETAINSGSKIYDGNYSLTATLDDGAYKTVRFSVNTKPEVVSVTVVDKDGITSNEILKDSEWYIGTLSFNFNTDKFTEMRLINTDTGSIISTSVEEIRNMTLETEEYTSYRLVFKDSKGLRNTIDFMLWAE